IAEKENLQISDEDLEQEVFHLAHHTHQTPEEVRSQLAKDQGLERIRARMRSEKALNFLYNKS
ncbi:MAG TPA: hypothetical protein VLT16_09715, partial [Candidatus Limnocylindrales bacterium]|nr:hypothetical protein [Candidatus Limnocylindrales bacterium]